MESWAAATSGRRSSSAEGRPGGIIGTWAVSVSGATQYPRNGLGDTTQLISPDTGTARHTYDAAGNLKTRTDSRGVLATYTYDALNRLTQVVYSQSGQTSLTFSWRK